MPITSIKPSRKVYPNEVLLPAETDGLEKESIVLCYQIRTLEKKRLIRDLGKIDGLEIKEEIIEACLIK